MIKELERSTSGAQALRKIEGLNITESDEDLQNSTQKEFTEQ